MAAPLKIGILTFHRCINYGSYWQARCLVEGLRALGYDAVLLDHDSPPVRWLEWRCALQPQRPLRGPPGDVAEHSSKTRQFLEAFDKLPRSVPFPTESPASAERFDVAVVGSDEVWNLRHPWYGGYPIFFGEGLKSDRLVSYAASFGNYDASCGLPAYWARRLANFAPISVRDQNSERIVRGALGSDPELVLDPCLLFPPAAEPDPAETRAPYVAVYGHGFPSWFINAVRKWSASSGYRLLSIGYRNDWADEQQIATAPERFARLMAGAVAVITNFFHGCVFALLNAKPFACISSDYRGNKVRDLMQTVDTKRHLVAEDGDWSIADLLGNPLDDVVDRGLASLRSRSLDYLRSALAP
jgi:hypothetical protein